jgi:heptosyltransferase I
VASYVAAARHLIDQHGARIVVTGGRTAIEREYGKALEAALGGAVVNLVGETSLKQLFAILEVADLLLCPDSGPAHLATAAGIPVVGLYATSNRLRTGPYFSQDLVADAYPEAVQREFGRPVADLRWGQRVRDPAAMELITVPMVIARLEAALARGRGGVGMAPPVAPR